MHAADSQVAVLTWGRKQANYANFCGANDFVDVKNHAEKKLPLARWTRSTK